MDTFEFANNRRLGNYHSGVGLEGTRCPCRVAGLLHPGQRLGPIAEGEGHLWSPPPPHAGAPSGPGPHRSVAEPLGHRDRPSSLPKVVIISRARVRWCRRPAWSRRDRARRKPGHWPPGHRCPPRSAGRPPEPSSCPSRRGRPEHGLRERADTPRCSAGSSTVPALHWVVGRPWSRLCRDPWACLSARVPSASRANRLSVAVRLLCRPLASSGCGAAASGENHTPRADLGIRRVLPRHRHTQPMRTQRTAELTHILVVEDLDRARTFIGRAVLTSSVNTAAPRARPDAAPRCCCSSRS